jgi:hypothetical protein
MDFANLANVLGEKSRREMTELKQEIEKQALVPIQVTVV